MTKKEKQARAQGYAQPLSGIGGELRARRRKLGLTYEQVADAMGIHWTTLRKWELGKDAGQGRLRRSKLSRKFLLGEFDDILGNTESKDDEEEERKLLQLCQCFYHVHCYHEMLHCMGGVEQWEEFQKKVGEIVRRNGIGEGREKIEQGRGAGDNFAKDQQPMEDRR